jgi:very-short-patch-repair endonuclease
MKGTLGYKVRTIACVSCGRTITGHLRPEQRYCSLPCYRNSPRPKRMTGRTVCCAVCKKAVYVPKARLGLKNYFCCTVHANAWQGRNKTSHVCIICDKSFRWSPSRQKNNNVKYCSITCRSQDPAFREQLRRMNLEQQKGRQTAPEKIGYALLDALGANYLPQHLIAGKFCVDAFIPSRGVVVQFDGDYWHGNPARFPTLDARQQRRVRLDRSQDAYMAKCGYHVVRLWESDLLKNLAAVRKKLRPFVTPPVPRPASPG